MSKGKIRSFRIREDQEYRIKKELGEDMSGLSGWLERLIDLHFIIKDYSLTKKKK